MLMEVNFSTAENLENQATFIQKVLGIPIVDMLDNTLIIEVDPETNVDEVRALQGVTSVQRRSAQA